MSDNEVDVKPQIVSCEVCNTILRDDDHGPELGSRTVWSCVHCKSYFCDDCGNWGVGEDCDECPKCVTSDAQTGSAEGSTAGSAAAAESVVSESESALTPAPNSPSSESDKSSENNDPSKRHWVILIISDERSIDVPDHVVSYQLLPTEKILKYLMLINVDATCYGWIFNPLGKDSMSYELVGLQAENATPRELRNLITPYVSAAAWNMMGVKSITSADKVQLCAHCDVCEENIDDERIVQCSDSKCQYDAHVKCHPSIDDTLAKCIICEAPTHYIQNPFMKKAVDDEDGNDKSDKDANDESNKDVNDDESGEGAKDIE